MPAPDNNKGEVAMTRLGTVMMGVVLGTYGVLASGAPTDAPVAAPNANAPLFTPPASHPDTRVPMPESSPVDQAQLELVVKGVTEFQAGRRQEALEIYDSVIEHYRTANADAKVDLYSARNAAEALFYMARSVNQKRDAKVVSRAWSDAYMMKGYALADMGQLKEAREAVEAAVALSPFNSQYLAELGYLHQIDHAWDESLETYKRSAEGAEISSPDRKNLDLARAFRGQGYALIELDRLDEAEALYRKAIELDGADTKAPNELKYIQQLREKKAQASK